MTDNLPAPSAGLADILAKIAGLEAKLADIPLLRNGVVEIHKELIERDELVGELFLRPDDVARLMRAQQQLTGVTISGKTEAKETKAIPKKARGMGVGDFT